MAVADLLAHPIAAASVETPAAVDGKALARWLGGAVRELAAEHWSSVATVAVGVPGSVHHEARMIANAPNLTQVSDPDFVPCLERELGRPLVLDNDVNLAFLGEHRFGAARGCSDAAMVNLGAGLGTALAVDGRILRGRTGLVGEYGSLPFDGGRLEDFITGHGIMRKAREQGIDIADPSVLFHEDRRDLDGLREAFDRAMLTVLVAVTVAIEPAIIVLGGGVAQGSRSRLAGYQDLLDRQVHPAPPLAFAGLRDFSGAAGAMVAALHEVYLELGVDVEALPLLPSTSVETFATLLAHQLAEGQSSRRDHS
jgi:predicted NBD/HSP70 family sugar kinase